MYTSSFSWRLSPYLKLRFKYLSSCMRLYKIYLYYLINSEKRKHVATIVTSVVSQWQVIVKSNPSGTVSVPVLL